MGRRISVLLLVLLGIAAPCVAAPMGSRSIKEVLHGRVEWLKGRRVAVTYDFSSQLQLLDFEGANPFNALAKGAWRVEEGKLVVAGSGAFRWKPSMDANVDVTVTVAAKDGRDAGVVLVESNMTNRCVVFAIADTFFSKKDRGARPRAHMINCCGVPERGADKETVFRYVKRLWEPVVKPGQAVELKVAKRGDMNRMELLGAKLEGRDVGIRIPKIRVALYVLESKASFTSLRIEGDLDSKWLLENDILHDPTEADRPAPDEPEDDGGEDEPAEDPFLRVRGWIETIKDASAAREEREKAAEALIKRKRVCDVPIVIMAGLLYSSDAVARELGIKVLKGITGKSLGYDPSADAGKRKSSIAKWWTWIRKNRSRIDKDEKSGGGK